MFAWVFREVGVEEPVLEGAGFPVVLKHRYPL